MNEIFINDLFFTFQGEGKNWGRRALFVRMPYCNLKCSWCDTEFNSFKRWSEKDFLSYAQKESCRFAVITGGEPTMNKHTPKVINLLKSLNYEIAIETNGCFEIPHGVDFVTVSPKRGSQYKVNVDALDKCSELKIVVDDGFDFNIAKDFEKTVRSSTRLSLSPEYGFLKTSFSKIESFIKENPKWRVSLQTHKFLNIK